jgi:hypothetical protein
MVAKHAPRRGLLLAAFGPFFLHDTLMGQALFP